MSLECCVTYAPDRFIRSESLTKPIFEYDALRVAGQLVDFTEQRWYIGSMKTKTSVSLSDDLLKLIDGVVEGENRRSAFIEEAVKAYLEVRKRQRRDRTDLQIINRLSEKLNREAEDVLSFQKDTLG
jgi:Arc/MetJ-type ribon-helix-helix transcriptional regulator